MFDRMYEISVNKDYEERIRKTAQENYATRLERANQIQSSILTRLGKSLVNLGIVLQRRPTKNVELSVPR